VIPFLVPPLQAADTLEGSDERAKLPTQPPVLLTSTIEGAPEAAAGVSTAIGTGTHATTSLPIAIDGESEKVVNLADGDPCGADGIVSW
jgi:hypothetical protein